MKEPKRQPPHAGEALTRADVIRLKKQHGGRRGLDLEGADLHEADLSELDLHGAELPQANLQGADLFKANLRRADLTVANLQGASLINANLQGTNLHGADLQGADMRWTDLRRARLQQADLRRACLDMASLRDADLENANWGDYVLRDEIIGELWWAASGYRALKQRHTEAGMYDIAGHFFYREMEARRKLAQKERRVAEVIALNAFRLLYGYGERPVRVIGWVVAVILGLALVDWAFGTVEHGFPDALYYSGVSFTALG